MEWRSDMDSKKANSIGYKEYRVSTHEHIITARMNVIFSTPNSMLRFRNGKTNRFSPATVNGNVFQHSIIRTHIPPLSHYISNSGWQIFRKCFFFGWDSYDFNTRLCWLRNFVISCNAIHISYPSKWYL